LKKKTDKKKTGNKQMKLSRWEQILFDAMNGDSNPTVNEVPGKKYLEDNGKA